jgi:hypothetical protein
MVVADGGRIHRTMPSLPYMECIIKVLLRVAIFSPAYIRVRISPLPPEFKVGILGLGGVLFFGAPRANIEFRG